MYLKNTVKWTNSRLTVELMEIEGQYDADSAEGQYKWRFRKLLDVLLCFLNIVRSYNDSFFSANLLLHTL